VKRLLGLVVVLGAIALAAGTVTARLLLQPLAQSGSPAQTFIVAKGAGLSRVAAELEAAGLVRSAAATEWLGRVRGQATQLHAGEYDLNPSWTPREILARLTSGATKSYPVVLPEGLRASEIAIRLEEAGLADAALFMAVVQDPRLVESLGVEGESLEGYLFPDTYRFPRDLPAADVASKLVERFHQTWKAIEPRARESGMTMQDVVTLASIVEKETGAATERPVIAAVFLNRLDKDMRLETDPAVIYGIANFDGNLKRRHLNDRGNPYNTYRHKGLPPGPIANPGEDALLAVVEPAENEYLYYVSRNDGTHKFSTNYRDHVNAVNRYQKRRRSR
jgi:UPF0755 protein